MYSAWKPGAGVTAMPGTESPFEQHAQAYDRWFEINRAVYESEIKAVGHCIPEDGKGLEVGVGTGRFAEPFGITAGIEPSTAMADIADERGINIVKGTGEHIPFRDSVFDFVLVVTTICFFDNVPVALRECFRVIKEGGCIVVGFVDRNTPLGKTYAARQQENEFYRHASFYSAEEIMDLLEQAGFSGFDAVQTVFGSLENITGEQNFRSGYGEGGFAVIKGNK